jgi:hypothetical protein
MSYLDGVSGQVLRADHSHHCDHRGVIFCTKCPDNGCSERMTPRETWKEKTKQKFTPNRDRKRKEK